MPDEIIPGAEPIINEPAIVEAPVIDNTDTVLGDAYDRLTKETLRDERGRFAADGTKIDSPDLAVVQDDGAGNADAAPPATGVSAPAHLPQAIKADWPNIPETSRAAIAAHQAEMDRKFGEVGKQLGEIKPFADTLSAAMAQIPECRGMSPGEMAQAAVRLAAIQSDMGRNPVPTLLGIIETYGVGEQLKAVLNGTEYQPPANAGTAALERELAAVKAELQKVSNPEFVGEQITKTMAEKEAGAAYRSFVSDEKRKEFHSPAVEALLPTMLQIVLDDRKAKGVGISQADLLAEAYDMAINAIPEVRAKVRAAEAKATAAVPDPRRADAARRATSVNIKPVTNGKDAPRSEEEVMGMAYDRAMAN